MNLQEKIKKLPSCPGVYLMKDSLNSVIYVGKSKNLKSRVGSYFRNSKSHSPKVLKLVKNLKDFDYIITDTEFEAFILECNLIKEIKPIYNRKMKNPKSYLYIQITKNDAYPEIKISNKPTNEDLYYGPYTNKNIVERGLQGIKEHYKILCNNSSFRTSFCLNYSLGLCKGMCLDSFPSKDYIEIINKIIKLLNGTDKSIIKEMEYIMNNYSDNLDFENALKYRDFLTSINYLIDKTKVVKYTQKNKNIILLEHLHDDMFKLFLIKGNKILFSEKYILTYSNLENLTSIIRRNILFYYNNNYKNNSIEVSKEDLDESHIIYNYLKNKSNNSSHILISQKWIDTLNNKNIDKSLSELFAINYSNHIT